MRHYRFWLQAIFHRFVAVVIIGLSLGVSSFAQVVGSKVYLDPCQTQPHTFTPISILGPGTTLVLQGIYGKRLYLCHVSLYNSYSRIGIVEGAGATCSVGMAGIIGGATSPVDEFIHGAELPLTVGDGSYAIAATATPGNNFCLITPDGFFTLTGVIVSVWQ